PDSEKILCLRDELSALIEFPTSELLETDLTDRDRVHYIYVILNSATIFSSPVLTVALCSLTRLMSLLRGRCCCPTFSYYHRPPVLGKRYFNIYKIRSVRAS